jgi:5'(3')-deoxyribonucleotidase
MLDADGVLVDFTSPVLEFLASVGKPKHYDQLTRWDVFDGDLELEDQFKERYASKLGFCFNLKPLPGAIEFVRAARDKYDIAIVTTPYDVPHWYNERRDWLVSTLGIARSAITFTHHKQFIEGDVLVEDKIENIVNWHNHWPEHLAVVMDQPWNRVDLPRSESNSLVRAVGFEQLSKRLEEFGLPRVF